MKYILCLLALCFFGCVRYDFTKQKCQATCENKQKNNVGSRFFWRDWDRTFGKCTCVSTDGSTYEFYIKAESTPPGK